MTDNTIIIRNDDKNVAMIFSFSKRILKYLFAKINVMIVTIASLITDAAAAPFCIYIGIKKAFIVTLRTAPIIVAIKSFFSSLTVRRTCVPKRLLKVKTYKRKENIFTVVTVS